MVTARVEYLYGCVHFCVENAKDKTSKPEEVWLDEQRWGLKVKPKRAPKPKNPLPGETGFRRSRGAGPTPIKRGIPAYT